METRYLHPLGPNLVTAGNSTLTMLVTLKSFLVAPKSKSTPVNLLSLFGNLCRILRFGGASKKPSDQPGYGGHLHNDGVGLADSNGGQR